MCVYHPKYINYCDYYLGLAARNELRAITDSYCVCPGEQIIYECTAVGGSFTVWDASFLEPDCRIEFSHFQFMNQSMIDCNNQAVVAEATEVNSNCYTSQLVVSVTPNLNNGTINCSVDYVQNVTLINTMTIRFNVTPGNLNLIIELCKSINYCNRAFLISEPPSDVQIIAANPTELVFGWIPPSLSCPSLSYFVDAKNCGVCQNSTTTNTTTCNSFTFNWGLCVQ